MTRTVGRVAYPERDVQWTREAGGLVEYATGPDVDELEQIGESMRAIEREQKGLVQAVRHARARDFSWARIGVILGVTRQAAQQRFGFVDEELHDQGVDVSVEVKAEIKAELELAREMVNADLIALEVLPESEPALVVEKEEPGFDFSSINALTNDEIIAMAEQLPKDTKMYDPYLRGLREAIVVTLNKRDMPQRKIADVIGRSTQRVTQILRAYYQRMEKVWEQERKDRRKGG